MDVQEYLEKRIAELAEERKQLEESLGTIKEKIAQADAKKGTQPNTPNYHKWSQILSDLEKDLQKTNGRIHYISVETEEKHKKLNDYREKAAEAEAAKAALPQRVLEMSLEELSELTAEEIAMLHEYELKQTALAEAERLAMEDVALTVADPDVRPETAGAGSGEGDAAEQGTSTSEPEAAQPAPEPPRQEEPETAAPEGPSRTASTASADSGESGAVPADGQALPRALGKVAENATGTLTLAEFELLIETYAGTMGKEEFTPQDEKLLDLLEASLLKINREHAQLRANWDRLAANA